MIRHLAIPTILGLSLYPSLALAQQKGPTGKPDTGHTDSSKQVPPQETSVAGQKAVNRRI
jgi:hypothetical protein